MDSIDYFVRDNNFAFLKVGDFAERGYVYANGDIVVTAAKGQRDYGIIRYFKDSGSVTLVKMEDELKYSEGNIKIQYSFSNTQRRYCNPDAYAGFLGALAEIGRTDVKCTGMCFSDGTSYPSISHPNGDSADTMYFNTLKEEQIKVNAFKKFNFTSILRGDNRWYPLLVGTKYSPGHNDHLHSGEFRLKVMTFLILFCTLLTSCKNQGSNKYTDLQIERNEQTVLKISDDILAQANIVKLPIGREDLIKTEFPSEWWPMAFDDRDLTTIRANDSAYFDKIIYRIEKSLDFSHYTSYKKLDFNLNDISARFKNSKYSNENFYKIDSTLFLISKFSSNNFDFALVTNGDKYTQSGNVSETEGFKKFTLLISLDNAGEIIDVIDVGYYANSIYTGNYKYFYIDKSMIYTKDFELGEQNRFLFQTTYGITDSGRFTIKK